MTKKQESKMHYILQELANHLPFSIFGVIVALILMGVLMFITQIASAEHLLPEASEKLFHIFHPGHILFSAIATTAMFWKHDNHNVVKAIVIGLVGSVFICSMSDVLVPFLGGLFLGAHMQFHLCIIEEPSIVFPFAMTGVVVGLTVNKSFERSTEHSHSVHVFLSSMASLLYLISFGFVHWTQFVGGVFVVTVFAVIFPCCLSDIVFPLTCSHKFCEHEKE